MNGKPIIPLGTDPRKLELSAALADKAKKDAIEMVKAHQEKIIRVTQKIEDILIEENMSWRDWNEVVNKFNNRNDYVFPRITIKEIKDKFDEHFKP